MEICFLSSTVPLVKSLSADTWTSYPLVKNFTSHTSDVLTPADLYDELATHSAQGHCLLKGLPNRPLRNEPRAGSTNAAGPTSLLVLDIDGLDTYTSIPALLHDLGLHNVSYVEQHSASSGLKPGLRSHLFFLISEFVSPQAIKNWMKHVNLSLHLLRENTGLTASGVTLHWPLDITVNQNDKLIYIAPPQLDVPDPINERIVLHTHQHNLVPASLFDVPDPTNDERDRVNELRHASGKYKKELRTGLRFNVEICTNPDEAEITGIKEGPEFTYLNLNSGDSWGYYHKTMDPSLLFNFKGEPTYALRDINKDYYRQARDRARLLNQQERATQQETVADIVEELNSPEEPVKETQPPRFLYFVDQYSGVYYTGYYFQDTDTVDLTERKTRQALMDACILAGMDKPEAVPDARCVVDFHLPTLSTQDGILVINAYEGSEYRTRTARREGCTMPNFTQQLIQHVLAYDEQAYDYYVNWLAYIWQTHRLAGTAWILQGTTGTGKGILVREVLRPIFGHKQVAPMRLTHFESAFNSWARGTLLAVVEESNMDSVKQHTRVIEELKNYIADDVIDVNEKFRKPKTIISTLNFQLHANNYAAMGIEENDRRFNIAPRQETKLIDAVDVDVMIEMLRTERQAFADYLFSYDVNMDRVRKPMVNESKLNLQETSVDTPRTLVLKLQAGDFNFFESLITHHTMPSVEEQAYRAVLTKIAVCVRDREGVTRLTREDLQDLFAYAVGWTRTSPTKFTRALGRTGLKLTQMPVHGDPRPQPAAAEFIFTADAGALARWLREPVSNVHPLNKARA